MRILWIWSSKRDGQSYHQENDGAAFQKHDEYMRTFCLAHPEMETTKSKDVGTANRLILVPIQKVKLSKYSQN